MERIYLEWGLVMKAMLVIAFIAAFVASPTFNPRHVNRKPYNCPICLSFWSGCVVGLALLFFTPHGWVLPFVAALLSKSIYEFIHS